MTPSPRLQSLAKQIAPYWTAAVLIGSFLPGSLKWLLGTRPYRPNHPLDWQHRLAHFLTFGLTTFIFLLAADQSEDEPWAAGASFLLGCYIEVGQHMTGLAAVFEWWDIRDDLLAVLLAYLLFKIAHRTTLTQPPQSTTKG